MSIAWNTDQHNAAWEQAKRELGYTWRSDLSEIAKLADKIMEESRLAAAVGDDEK
jgi:hypothetical protein